MYLLYLEFIFLADQKSRLQFVRIYFDTPTFDRITKDRRAKFVDMLAAVGGTIGLFTGFSVISAIEIIFFLARFLFGFVQRNPNK